MMKERFRKNRFSQEKVVLLTKISGIIGEYQAQNIKLTLRQLYYQLVSRDIIANTLKEYSKLSDLVTTARYNGLIDWDAIEDRIRVARRHVEFDDIYDLVESAKQSYRLDRWKGQDFYVELFTEKDALASVLKPIADKWHIYFSVNRGYTSASAMYDSYERFDDIIKNTEKHCVLLYLGDHDPSGLDMVRDIKDRLVEFLMGDLVDEEEEFKNARRIYIEDRIDVVHIALTTEQVNKYKPPPNPAKMTDPRARWYVERFGKTSWEVDALRPEIMMKMVNDSILSYVDVEKMNKIISLEKTTIKPLEELALKLKKKFDAAKKKGEDKDEMP